VLQIAQLVVDVVHLPLKSLALPLQLISLRPDLF
jgi:hypothetical protein